MHKPTPILLALCAFVSTLAGCPLASAQGGDASSLAPNAALGVVGASLARAEEALSRSLVSSSQVKGVFGEEVMERIVLKGSRSTKWHAVSLSPKPQGIDGIYLRRNRSGQPSGLLVAEAKFRTAKLGKTKDGIQLSANWTSSRLSEEASRYRQASQGRTVQLAARPNGLAANPDVVKAQLPDGRVGYLWRKTKTSPWFYEGPSGTLDTAQSVVRRDGQYLKGAADGTIRFRQRLYKIDVTRDTISVDVRRARTTGNGGVKLTHMRVVKMRSVARDISPASKRFMPVSCFRNFRILQSEMPAQLQALRLATCDTWRRFSPRGIDRCGNPLCRTQGGLWELAPDSAGSSTPLGNCTLVVLSIGLSLVG